MKVGIGRKAVCVLMAAAVGAVVPVAEPTAAAAARWGEAPPLTVVPPEPPATPPLSSPDPAPQPGPHPDDPTATTELAALGPQAELLSEPVLDVDLSADGRWAVFSTVSPLVAGVPLGVAQVYRRDLQSGAVDLVSRQRTGDLAPADADAFDAHVSDDGRYVAFLSRATNLGASDGHVHAYFVDTAGTWSSWADRPSTTAPTEGDAADLTMSPDGYYIAYSTVAAIDAEDTNGVRDVYRSYYGYSTTLVSVSDDEVLGNHHASSPSISRDGRYVAFASGASNLVADDGNDRVDVFVRDLSAAGGGATRLVSVGQDGSMSTGSSWAPSISTDGHKVAFLSDGDDLVPGEEDQQPDVYVRDVAVSTIVRVSTSDTGAESPEPMWEPKISDDGRTVAFRTAAALTALDDNGQADVYARDRQSGDLEILSVGDAEAGANGPSGRPVLSANGSAAAFISLATNLAPDGDVRADALIRRRTIAATLAQPPVASSPPTIEADRLMVGYEAWVGTLGAWSELPTSYAYQWLRCDAAGDGCTPLDGATSSWLSLDDDALEGARLRIEVTATNAAGSGAARSAPTEPIAARPGPPVNLTLPTVTGEPYIDFVQQADPGTWDGAPDQLDYQWYRCDANGDACAPIEFEDYYRFWPWTEDEGSTLRVEVTATNPGGSTTAMSAPTAVITAPPVPTNVTAPTLSGDAVVGGWVELYVGQWTYQPYETRVRWEACTPDLTSCTERPGWRDDWQYEPAAEDLGLVIRATVRRGNYGGLSEPVTTAPTAQVALPPVPQNTAPPTLAPAAPRVGGTMSVSVGSWSPWPDSYERRWYRCAADGTACEAFGAPNTGSVSLLPGDEDHRFRVDVRASNPGGTSAWVSSDLSAVVTPAAIPTNTTLPSITGTPAAGSSVTVDRGQWSDSPTAYRYRWQGCDADGARCVDLGAETSSTSFYVDGSLGGQRLRVLVRAENVAGTSGWVASGLTGVVPSVDPPPPPPPPTTPPVNVTPPSISTAVVLDQYLYSNAGEWSPSPTSFAYRWQRCDGADVCTDTGVTSYRYRVTTADVGYSLQLLVTASNSVGSSAPVAAPRSSVVELPPAPTNTRAPYVSGTIEVDQGVYLQTGSWTPYVTSFEYRWERCDPDAVVCTDLGNTSSYWTLSDADIGQRLRGFVRATNHGGTSEWVPTALTSVVPPRPPVPELDVAPFLYWYDGPPAEGSYIYLNVGEWTSWPRSYRITWERCSDDLLTCSAAGSSSSSYALGTADIGSRLRATVYASNAGGESTGATSDASPVIADVPPAVNVSPPTIIGAPVVGEVLRAGVGEWTGGRGSFSYRWQRCDAAGSSCVDLNAYSDTYRPVTADVGSALRVRVTESNRSYEYTDALSAVTAVVASAGPPVIVTAPLVVGGPAVGETLVADVGAWNQPVSSFTVEWLRCDAAGGSCELVRTGTDRSIVLEAPEIGATYRVRVTAANDSGTATATSASVGPIVAGGATADPALVERVAASTSGQLPRFATADPWFSLDGRYVVFVGRAADYVPELRINPPSQDVLLRDLLTGRTVLASGGATGLGGNASSFDPVVSADGAVVVFTSSASDLVPGDTNGRNDIFRWDRTTDTIERVSLGNGGAQLGGHSGNPSVTADGSKVSFQSGGVYVRDVAAGTTTTITGEGGSSNAALSADGSWMAVRINGSAIYGNCGFFNQQNVYRVNVVTGARTNLGTQCSTAPSISADGSTVAWHQSGNVLVSVDGAGASVVAAGASGPQPNLSMDGITVVFTTTAALDPADANGVADVYVHVRGTGEHVRVSRLLDGTEATLASTGQGLTGDGMAAAFQTDARLVPADQNSLTDAYIGRRAIAGPSDTTLEVSTTASRYGEAVTLTARVSPAEAGVWDPAGQVVFYRGTTRLGARAVGTDGTATLSLTSIPVGAHALHAEFAGGGGLRASISPDTSLTVAATDTTVSVVPSADPTVWGQARTLTVGVSPVAPGGGVPAGSVRLTVDGTTRAPRTLDVAGRATFAVGDLEPGDHSIVVDYDGSSSHLPSSFGRSLHVDMAATSVALATDAQPQFAGEPITYSIWVRGPSASSAIPTGTVQLFDGATLLGDLPLDAAGRATLTTSALAEGDHPVTAAYSGDGGFLPSASAVLQQAVRRHVELIEMDAAPDPSVFGQAVTLSATVVGSAGGPAPTGTVTFRDGSRVLGSAAVGSGGTASRTVSDLAVGVRSLSATYSGDGIYGPEVSAQVDQTVDRAASAVSVTSDWNPSGVDQSVTFTAHVAAVAPGAGRPTGFVTFAVDGVDAATVVVDSAGNARYTAPPLARGVHVVLASYGGDGSFEPSASDPYDQVVGAATDAALVSDTNPSTLGDPVTLTASVTAEDPSAGVPAGTVVFLDGNDELGSAPVDGTGTATLVIDVLPLGEHTVVARYLGNGSWGPSESAAVIQRVERAATTVVLTADVPTSVHGQPVSLTATVASSRPALGTTSGFVTFDADGAPLGTASVQADGTSVLTVSLPAGAHVLAARYGGNAEHAPSTSAELAHDVARASADLSLTVAPSISALGAPVIVDVVATAVAPGAGVPGGDVEIVVDGEVVAAVVLDQAGRASSSLEGLPLGVHTVVARSAGDAAFDAATSEPVEHEVGQPTATALTSTPSGSVVGQEVFLTATVTSGSAAVTSGAVTFLDGTTELGTVLLDGSGIAALATSDLAAGDRVLEAVYQGASGFAPSRITIDHRVAQGATSVEVTSSVNPSVRDYAVTFTATVSVVAPATGTPTGVVTFFSGDAPIGTRVVSANGTAALTVRGLDAGTHQITASYGGDADLLGSTSDAITQVVEKVAPISQIDSDQKPIRSGRTLTVKAGFRGPNGGRAVGTIELLDGDQVIATAPLDGEGVATFLVDDLPVGTHVLTASFPGDLNYLPATTDVLQQVVRASIPSYTELAVTPNPAAFREPVVLAASVHRAGDTTSEPSGFVTFTRDGVVLGTAAVISGGSASLTLSVIPPGTGSIQARYGGDAIFGPSASLATALTISAERFLSRTTTDPVVVAGVTSDVITVRIHDGAAPVVAPAGGFSLALQSSSPTGRFRSVADGVIDSVTIPEGASEASFRYTDVTAGAPVLTLDAGVTSGAAPLRFRASVVPAALHHLAVTPGVVTSAPGAGVAFAAHGLDEFGNSVGDRTAQASFAISPDGTCAASTCTPALTGSHTVTAEVDGTFGAATLIGDHLPEITVTPDDPDGQAPHTVRFSVTAVDADAQDALAWAIDFGDGSPVVDGGAVPAAGAFTIEHTYLDECRSCVVSVTVDDGVADPAGYETARVDIASPAPLRADAGDPVATVTGEIVAFNGARSTPAPPGIETYLWTFGDGTTATGPSAEHSFAEPGLYPVSLTVSADGLSSTDTVPVRVQLPPGPGLTAHVSAQGVPLTGASILVHDALGQAHPATEVGGGEYVVPALPDGEHTVYAFKSGFTPATATGVVVDGSGEVTIDLAAGAVAVADLTTRRLSADEAIELGVDPDAAANQNVFQFSLNLSFNEEEQHVTGVVSASAFHHVSVGGQACGCTRRVVVQGNGFVAVAYPAPDRLLWIIIPGQAKWLKEFFEAKLQVTNLAPEGFTLTEGQATLQLPHGLSLADVTGEPQQLSSAFPDVPGGESRDATWILRGDVEGFYDLEADYTGVLDPVGEVVRLHAETDVENQIHVWGGSALNLEFEVDDHAWEGRPYLVRVKVRNVADVPVYNPMITMLPAPEDIDRDYLFQPRQQLDMGTARIEPGEVFETGDYVVAPRFDGALNLEQSFVLQTGGNQFVEHTITTRPAPEPSLPQFQATLQSDGVHVSWGAVDGALGYQLFTTPDYMVNFPFAPVASAPAGATSAVLPYRPEGYGLVALSTLVPGPDGRPRNQLRHALIDLGARVAAPEDPCSAFGWSPFGSTVGNFTTSYDDLEVAVPGPTLAHSRTYNSLSTNVGWFGLGWSSDYEMRTSGDSRGNVVVQHPDGRCEMFVRSADDYARLDPVSGRDATVVADGAGGFRLLEADGTTYAFSIEGRLDTITDAAGRRQALTYGSGGHLETVTDVSSGRSLHFAWDGEKVAQVATDPVTAGGSTAPLTWTYAYVGDHLVEACDPRGGCWSFEHGTAEAPSERITEIRKPEGNAQWLLAYTDEGYLERKANGAGTTTRYEYPEPTTGAGRVVRTIDAAGNVTVNEHDERHRLVRSTVTVDGEDLVTSYGYDAQGRRTSVTDALNVTASAVYDDRGNLRSRTDGSGATTWFEYDGADLLQVERDPRSSGPADGRYATDYDYNQFRQVVRVTGPATATVPSAVTERSYSNGQVAGDVWVGTDPAIDGGVVPNSLVVEERDASGGVTTYRYDRFGDVREVVDPAGLVSTFTYDEIGRRTSETLIDPVHGSVTTTWAYDAAGNVTATTGPVTVDPVTGAQHQLRVSSTYDLNGNTLTTAGTDVPTGATRPSSFTFDDADRLVAATDPEGGVTARTYDARGLVATVTDAEGRVTRTDYDERGLPVRETLLGFVDDPIGGSAPRDLVLQGREYDAVGRPVAVTDALGRTFRTSYDRADRVTEVRLIDFEDPDGTTRDVIVSATPSYDGAGNPLVEVSEGGLRRVTNTWDEAGRLTASTLEVGDADRTETYGYLPNGEVASIRAADPAGSTLRTFTYDTAGRLLSETVDDGAGGLTTRFEVDTRGNVVREIDPRGTAPGADSAAFATEFGYDAAGRPVRMTAPAVALDGTTTTVRPETFVGWSAFDDQISHRDARGNVTGTTYDGLSRITRVDHPTYLTPAGASVTAAELFEYDQVGNLVQATDRRGQVTDYDFDALNRVVRQRDPLVSGAAGRGEVRFAYDDAGNVLSATDQIGAVREWRYDDLDRAVEAAVVVRDPSGDTTRPITRARFDDGGRPLAVTDPTGATTAFAYNGAGEVVEQVDALGEVTSHDYDHAGRLVRSEDALGRSTRWTYDPAGRLVAEEHLDQGGVLTRATAGYDRAGNLVALTSPRGAAEGNLALHTTTRELDALGRVTAIFEPASPTTTLVTRYGYDAGGNLTRAVDGRGVETQHTYQAWGLPESTIEPATAAHPAPADRTFTTTYDAGGLPIQESRPGVTISRTFDQLGRLTAESGSGAGAATASRSLGWDLAGRVTSISHPNGAMAVSWDDRGLITGVTGPAGTSSFAYDAAGRVTQRTDAAGVASFTWTARGELDTATDPVTGTTRDLTWDAAGQLVAVANSSGASEALSYDGLGRATAEELRSNAGTVLTRHAYGYDADGNLTTQTDSLTGNTAAGANTYAYDAAARMTSWTAPGGAVTPYAYDAAGNRTQIGAQALTYDERNRLLTGPEGSLSWTPRGTLATATEGTTVRTFAHDAFDRLVSEQAKTPGLLGDIGELLNLGPPLGPTITTTTYAFDGLDRVASRNGAAFGYAGLELDPVSDATAVYGRGAMGELVSALVGGNASLVGTDSHGDVTHLWQPAGGGAVSGTRTFDPLGVRTSQTGINPAAGFQGDYTDPTTGRVWMGARWYSPRSGVFAERDTWAGQLDTPISLNRYTYGYSNPRSWFDPDGHSPESDFWCGGFDFGPFFPQDGTGGGGEDFDPWGWISDMADQLGSGNFGDFADTFARGAQQALSATANLARQVAAEAYRTVTNVVRSVDLTNVHTVLDIVGFIPGVGAFADGANAILYAAEGDWVNAGISAAGMLFDGATAFRGAGHVADAAADGARFVRDSAQRLGSRVASGIADNVVRGARRVGRGADDLVSGISRRADDLAGAVRGSGRMADDFGSIGSRAAGRSADDIARAVPPLPPARPPIVIGENMKRVREYADQIGGHAYRPWKNDPFDYDLGMRRNRRFIRDARHEGREIIDIGPDFARRRDRLAIGHAEPRSPFYEMERRELVGYDGRVPVFGRSGDRGGVPGLDPDA